MSKRRRLLIIVPLALVLGTAGLTATDGGLGWFCPHTLEYRTQSERTVLYGTVVIYRSEWHPAELPFVDFLIRAGHVTPLGSGECPRWHPMFHWNRSWRDGYSLLHRVFSRHRWAVTEWSQQHPECARILWPEVFRLLRSNDPHDHELGETFAHETWRRVDSVSELRTMMGEIAHAIRPPRT